MALAPMFLAAPSALGQQPDRPLQLPNSDVSVVYRFDKVTMNGPHKLKVTYADAGQRVRVDLFRWLEAKSPYRSEIFDGPANRLITVLPERRAYIDNTIGSAANPGEFIKSDVRLKRQETATVAFAKCTEWVLDAPGKEYDKDVACVTDGGILLRAAPNLPSRASLTAIEIHYGAPPDGAFEPPTGYHKELPP
jgi:hypothetical protein